MHRNIRINNLFIFFIVGLFWLLWGIFPPLLWAGAFVSSVSGTVSNGQNITIVGSGFGANGPTIIVFDDFEKGTDGNQISTAENSAQVNKWNYVQGLSDEAVYSTDYSHSGTKAAKFNYNYKGSYIPLIGLHDVFSIDSGESIFFSWWQYLPANKDVPGTNGPEGGGCNWKQFWLYNSVMPNKSDYMVGTLTNSLPPAAGSTIFCMLNDQPYGSTCYPWATADYQDYFQKGEWYRRWVYMKAGYNNDAIVGHYGMNQTSGFKTYHYATGVKNLHQTYPWDHLHFPGYGRQDTNAILYYDDIYVATGSGSNAQARVEIGNNATYSKCTKLTILTPTLWSDTSITATVRQGSFTNGSSAFLFVFDANGAVNTTGYPITIGGPPPPGAPTGLKIIN